MQFVIRGAKTVRRDGLSGIEVDFERMARQARVEPPTIGDQTPTVDDSDLVEVELESGLVIAMTGAELRQSDWFALRAAREAPSIMELVPRIDGSRGFFDGWLKRVTALFYRQAGEDRLRELLLDVVEQRLCNEPGFFRVDSKPGAGDAGYVNKNDHVRVRKQSDVPLILLHGTFSSTMGSFGGWLSNEGESARLWRRYQRIYTLEHRTLATTPIENALAVLERLDRQTTIDLVGYSRGGLIGELLAQKSLDDTTVRAIIERLRADGVDEDQRDLRNQLVDQYLEFQAKLGEKQIQVRRFVRVACPARGTRLASRERLRNVLSLLRYGSAALQKFLSGVPSAVLQAVTSGLAGLTQLTHSVVLDKVKPNLVPGLYAMDPRRHFIRHLINHEALSSDAELANVGADTRRGGINLGRVADFVLDLYYGRANDWVVDTASMIGGARRSRVVEHLVDSERMHTQYFADPAFAQVITDGLVQERFETLTQLQYRMGRIDSSELRQVRAGGNARGPVLFVLPGIMGSQLVRENDKLWLDIPSYVTGGFKRLRIDQTKVEANGFVGKVYAEFCDAFRGSHEVLPFPYDWRHSVADAGKRLNDALKRQLARIDIGKRPIQIVAHSMGGLVVRAMLSEADSAWPAALANAASRIVMLGTPNQGSHAITAILSGQEGLMRKLAMVDLTESQESHIELVSRFPGILDMLPVATDDHDPRNYFDADQWELALQPLGNKWPRPAAAGLQAAQAVRTRLAQIDLIANRVYYIAGQAPETPCALASAKGKPIMATTPRGDGRVLWDTGIPSGVPFWFAPRIVHGDLPGSLAVQRACADILKTGDSNALPRQEPEPMKSGWFSWLRDGEEIGGSLSPDEFEALALGGSGGRYADADPGLQPMGLVRLDTSIAWGHLKDADYPLFVGHYQGDGIFGAEWAVDEMFEKHLSHAHRSGQYPGAIGTQRVFHRQGDDGAVQSAVVVGLGEIGGLNATTLRRAIAGAVIAYATSAAEQRAIEATQQEQRRSEESESQQSGVADNYQPRGLSFLLIGSSTGGVTVREAGRAILQGVIEARKAIKGKPYDLTALRRLQFIELYEDVAHTLWYHLADLFDDGDPLACSYHLDNAIDKKRDGRKRMRTDESSQWWQPLKIEKRGSELVFTNLASKARAEVSTVKVDKLVSELIAAQIANPRRRRDAEYALFELLIPLPLKDLAPESSDLRLLVTPGAAAYPWEMLSDRLQAGEERPQSVRVGMVRQLSALQFRAKPLISQSRSALIIIDPRSSLAELPGAQREGEAVLEALRDCGWAVMPSRRDEPGEIIVKQFGRGYGIVHYCGHGVADVRRYTKGFDQPQMIDDPENAQSGMVLGNGVFLTAETLESLRELPRLAFINCCHLGAIQEREPSHQIAAHFAEKLILMGVPCVIAAGWAVDDLTAAVFAQSFYRAFLRGRTFGESVKLAREAAYAADPNGTTFAAYQCYGDPSYALGESSGKKTSKRTLPPTDSALIAEVLPLARSVERVDAAAAEVAAHAHLQTPAAYEALAQAYEHVGELDKAVAYYQRSVTSSDNRQSAQLKSLTPLVNLQSRIVLQRYREQQAAYRTEKAGVGGVEENAGTAPPDLNAAVAEIEALAGVVSSLLDIRIVEPDHSAGTPTGQSRATQARGERGPADAQGDPTAAINYGYPFRTSERLGLLGATLRRQALLAPEKPDIAVPALERALTAYQASEQALQHETSGDDPKAINAKTAAWIRIAFTARALALQSASKRKSQVDAVVTEALSQLASLSKFLHAPDRRSTDNDWDTFLLAQIEIVEVYAGKRKAWSKAKTLTAALRKARNAANRAAIGEQIAFMEAFLPSLETRVKSLMEELRRAMSSTT